MLGKKIGVPVLKTPISESDKKEMTFYGGETGVFLRPDALDRLPKTSEFYGFLEVFRTKILLLLRICPNPQEFSDPALWPKPTLRAPLQYNAVTDRLNSEQERWFQMVCHEILHIHIPHENKLSKDLWKRRTDKFVVARFDPQAEQDKCAEIYDFLLCLKAKIDEILAIPLPEQKKAAPKPKPEPKRRIPGTIRISKAYQRREDLGEQLTKEQATLSREVTELEEEIEIIQKEIEEKRKQAKEVASVNLTKAIGLGREVREGEELVRMKQFELEKAREHLAHCQERRRTVQENGADASRKTQENWTQDSYRRRYGRF